MAQNALQGPLETKRPSPMQPAEFRDRAIELGAQPVTGRELITRLRDSGLRRRRTI